MMSEQHVLDQRSGVIHSESAQGHGDDGVPHDSDDEPMVYEGFPVNDRLDRRGASLPGKSHSLPRSPERALGNLTVASLMLTRPENGF